MAQKINEHHVFYRTPTKYYPTVDRGEGVYIYDKEGKQYIDGSGGAAVGNIGHGVKGVEEASIPSRRSSPDSRTRPSSAPSSAGSFCG